MHQWIDHGIANNRPLDAVVDDIVNDRIVPDTQSNLEVTEDRPGIDLLRAGHKVALVICITTLIWEQVCVCKQHLVRDEWNAKLCTRAVSSMSYS